jgi:hypothetical protein
MSCKIWNVGQQRGADKRSVIGYFYRGRKKVAEGAALFRPTPNARLPRRKRGSQ